MRRRTFIELVAATPLLTVGCQQAGRPTTPTPLSQATAPDAAPSQPPVANPPLPSAGPAIALTELPARVEGGELIVVIAGTPLENIGGVARSDAFVSGLHRYVLLARTALDRIHAMDGICTHEGCIIRRVAAPAFECPCHGSQYDHSGTVLRGPAPAALPVFSTTFDGVTVRIRV